MPVVLGKLLSKTFGIIPLTLFIISFIILTLNCSDETYLYVKKPPPNIPKTSTVVKIVKASSRRIFFMIKKVLVNLTMPALTMTMLLLLIGLAPLYIISSYMVRNLEPKMTTSSQL